MIASSLVAALTGSNPQFDKVQKSPKHAGCLTEVSRNMLLQSSPDIESLMRDDFAKVLADWLDSRPFDSEYVSLNMTKQSVGYRKPFVDRSPFMRRICDLAGVKRFGFHAIRHLTATKLYRDGRPVSEIQQVLRHKNPNTTARYLRSLGHEDCREGLEASLRLPG